MLRFKIFTFALFFVFAISSAEAKDYTVKAEGFALKEEKEEVTKKKALKKAMADAVKNVAMTMMDHDTYIKNKSYVDSKILRSPERFVHNYRVTAKGWVTHLDMVGGSEGGSMDGALVSDSDGSDDTELNINVEEDGPFLKAITEGVETYHVWITAGIDIELLKNELSSITSVAEDVETSNVSIVMLDIKGYKEYEGLKKKLSKIDLIKKITERSFRQGRFIVNAEVSSTTHELWERLTSELGTGFIVVPSGLDSITVKAAKM